MNIKEKVALVTGGSGGLGSVHCISLANAGYKVAVAAHTHLEKAKAVADKIKSMGKQAVAFRMDVANPDEVETNVDNVEKILGPVDVLINNAATGIDSDNNCEQVFVDAPAPGHWKITVEAHAINEPAVDPVQKYSLAILNLKKKSSVRQHYLYP